MAELLANNAQRKKRKLRFPRATQACGFCRRRKVRCSGACPCETCVREEAVCEFEVAPETPRSPGSGRQATIIADTPVHSRFRESDDTSRRTIIGQATIASRPSSLDPPQTFTADSHVGPTSGVSFLYGQWGKTGPHVRDIGDTAIPHAPLVSWGDVPQGSPASRYLLSEKSLTTERLLDILDCYFQYTSPTYRFLHHPTVKQWAIAYISQRELSAVSKACVLLVCAQTLLTTSTTFEQHTAVRDEPELSLACFEEAKALLDRESGPPSLSSVQARIAFCLYLLSTFRLNECRYAFSFAVTIATTIGIHRKQSSMSKKVDTLEAECRKRTFWSLYVLDGYLGVMLGRPRLLRDEDIDQPFPRNIADHDLTSDEMISDLPQHGNLEAAIAHSKLAKLMAKSNDLLYPLHSLSNDQLLQRSNDMLDALDEWQNDLPTFLQARQKTLTGRQTFARQNTILKLAFTHVQILSTRRCLLMDLTHPSKSQDLRARRCIQACVNAIAMVLDTVEVLIEQGQCYKSFWSTQYIALVAISTLYVLVIQGIRTDNFTNMEDSIFERARYCHGHLATLSPAGSQAERHHELLSHLRSKAERRLSKQKLPQSDPRQYANSNAASTQRAYVRRQDQNIEGGTSTGNNQDHSTMTRTTYADLPAINPGHFGSVTHQGVPNNESLFDSVPTPSSTADTTFQYLIDFGWESLDTVGACVRDEGVYGFQGI